MKDLYMRFIATALMSIMLVSVFACSDDAGAAPGGEKDTAPATEEAETEENLGSVLPQTDLEGYEYRIFANGEVYIATIFTDALDGNLINDAVYTKIKTVEDYLNVSIKLSPASDPAGGDEDAIIRKEVMSGMDTFDIVQGHDITMANLSLEKMFVDAYTVPYLDFTQPWWPADTIESMTVMGQMYLMSNNISYFRLGETRVMFFNKGIFNDINIPHPYKEVYDGTWTLDKLNNYAKQGYQDLNGDGQVNSGDRFGLVNPGFYYCWLEPFKVEPYVKDENGQLYYSFDLDKMQALVEQFYRLLFSGYGINVQGRDESNKVFCDGKSMFIYDSLKYAVSSYSFSDISYGILPMPKLHETDKEYYGGCTDRPVAIPITIKDLEKTGIVTEALNFAGYKYVFPAYYEIALKTRYADHTDDANMIDIVHNNAIMSFTYLFGNYQSPYNNMLDKLFNNSKPSTDVASYAKSIEKAQNARIAEIMEFYQEMAAE